jgi:hypothetical protein
MNKPTGTTSRIDRAARLRWVPIAQMRVSPLAQRELNQARVDRMAANFDPEQVGTPTVNQRDGGFYIIDGQHRVATIKAIGWDDQSIQCWAYEGLTEAEEAATFLRLNDTLAVHAFDKFRVGVEAGLVEECDIDRIVRAAGLVVSRDRIPGAIRAVGTLRRVYDRAGPGQLSRALRIVRDAYGDPGMEAAVIDGIGLLCQRYGQELDDDATVKRLSNIHGGVNGLLNKAEVLRRQTGNQKGHCVAAAAVDIVNAGRGGKKLPSWWKADEATPRLKSA